MKRILLIYLILFSIELFAQNNQIDSLLKLLPQADTKTKISLYFKLIEISNIKQKSKYITEAENIIKKLPSSAEKFDYTLKLANYYIKDNQKYKAFNLYQYSKTIADYLNNDSLKAVVYHRLGNLYIFTYNYDSALIMYQKSLDIREKIHDISGIAAINNNIGTVYWNLEDYNSALTYYKKALQYYQKLKDSNDIRLSYNNIGASFYAINKLDSAKVYYQKALRIAKKLKIADAIATLYNNLGSLADKKKKHRKAIALFLKSRKYTNANSYKDLTNIYINLANEYLILNRLDSAKLYLDSAYILSKKYKIYDKLYKTEFFIAQYYNKLKQYDSAYIYLLKYIALKDSIKGITIQEYIRKLETKYETQKKEKELYIQKLKYDQEKQKNRLLTIFSVIFIILIIILLMLIRKMRHQNIKLKQQKAEILQQKEEILTQAEQLKQAFDNIEKQNKIIKEVNKQLKDSIEAAQQIQAAMLPFKETYEKYFETFIIYMPKDIVSGDFYWFSRYYIEHQGHKYLYAAVADCTGHGVPGAFMSMIGFRMFDDLIYTRKIISPAEFLEELDKLIKYALKQDISENKDGMDVAIVRFEKLPEDKIDVVFAGAKRDLIYYDPFEKKLAQIKATRRSIGGGISKAKLIPFENKQFIASKETIFYMYSDGFTDQNNAQRHRFGSHRLLEILQEIAHLPLENQKQILETTLKNWMRGTFQRDDITFIGLKLK